ncbi:hypothetical protein [Sphingomonas sp.]|uniref:hypothetical protein n=1 Tax=Sphingomonas sp. TaxID=28214 RepID=UPI003F6E44F4
MSGIGKLMATPAETIAALNRARAEFQMRGLLDAMGYDSASAIFARDGDGLRVTIKRNPPASDTPTDANSTGSR